jgi:hypothetical protein
MYSRKSDRREDFVLSNNPVKHCDGTPSGSRAAGYSHVTYSTVHERFDMSVNRNEELANLKKHTSQQLILTFHTLRSITGK